MHSSNILQKFIIIFDHLIHSYNLFRFATETSFNFATDIIKDIQPGPFFERLYTIYTENYNDEYFWQRTPSFLDNNERNGGLSSSRQDENNQITEIAQ